MPCTPPMKHNRANNNNKTTTKTENKNNNNDNDNNNNNNNNNGGRNTNIYNTVTGDDNSLPGGNAVGRNLGQRQEMWCQFVIAFFVLLLAAFIARANLTLY